MVRRFGIALTVIALTMLASSTGTTASVPQGTQSDKDYAKSFARYGVTNVVATTQRTSCYTPEVPLFTSDGPNDGYTGMSDCLGASNTGEALGPYATQAGSNPGYPAANPMLVKDHSESDIRVDPTNSNHLIGQSKWFVSAEGYNHLLGFYESFDGGASWPTQGHVPGYEGWTDNTDPVGAFDQNGNFYSLMLPYNFAYSKSGTHVFNNGSNQTNPTVPPEAISVSVRPHGSTGPNDWITTHNGHPDFIATAKNANTSDPDKQWIAIDTNPRSPCRDTVYAMWTIFVLSPS